MKTNDGYISYSNPVDKNMMKMFLEHPDYMKRIMITENQASVIKEIIESGEPSVTSRTLAKMRGISIQSASNQLTKLWYRGYLERREVIDETGGIIYVYRSTI